MTNKRKDCPMRHENGNCTVAGGFCTAVNDQICEALHNAFDCGYRSALRQQVCVGDVNKSLTLDELSERNAPVFCQSKIFRMVGIGVCAKTDTSFLQVDTDLWQKRGQTGCFTARRRRGGRYEQETS